MVVIKIKTFSGNDEKTGIMREGDEWMVDKN